MLHGQKGSEELPDNYRTPKLLISKLNERFGFDIDVAADSLNRICNKFISQEEDAFQTEWKGTTAWCNPPYSRIGGGAYKWLCRGYHQCCGMRHCESAVFLLMAGTAEKYFYLALSMAQEICLLSGRVSFENSEGKKAKSPPFGSMLVIFHAHEHYENVQSAMVSLWDWRHTDFKDRLFSGKIR